MEEEDLECVTDTVTESEGESRPARMSLQLIAKRHLPPDASGWDQDKIITALNKISHLRLDRENIADIDSLELLGPRLTNIYLQMNRITKIENLGCQSLVFLMLSGNRIQVIENLTCLPKLAFLDLSDNQISNFDIDELPQSLVILNLKNNPCTSIPDHRGRIIQELASLRQLDEEEVGKEERLEAGYAVSSEEEEEDEEDRDQSSIQGLDDSVKNLTNEILLRSQDRLEQSLEDHKKRNIDMENMRIKHKLPPSSARSRGPTPRDS